MAYAELHWYEAHGVGARIQDQANYRNSMKRVEPQFVVCIKNKGYAASLELRKLYLTIPDQTAAKLRQIRVIDESGEDYLYPEAYFVTVQIPEADQKAVRRATHLQA